MKKWVGVAILVLLAGSSMAQEQAMPPGAEAFKKGQEAANKGNWDAAIPALEKALSENPDLYASHYYLGFAYSNKRNFEKAGEHFAKFLEKVQADPEAAKKAAEWIANANRYGGIALARAGDANRAIPLLEKAVAAKPNDAEAHFFLGVVLLQSNQEGKAQEHFAKVIQLSPDLPDPYYYSGRIAFNRDNFDVAKEQLEKFLQLKPDSSFAADAHFMLGTIAVRQAQGAEGEAASAQHQAAKEHLEKFLELKPDSPQAPQAHYILGSLAAQSDDVETARAHFEKYLELQPDGPQAEEVKKFLAELKKPGEE